MKTRNLLQKKIRCLICMAVIVALVATLTACGATKKDYLEKPGRADQYIHSHPVGNTVRYDLNGDGTGENITVNTGEYDTGKLTIGNSSVEFWSDTPTGYFTVLNVDKSKDTLLVGISDYGPSDDPETRFYAYDGKYIKEVGCLTDIFGENSYGHDSAVCHGDGTVTAGKRWNVLGTWNSLGQYKVSKNGISDITDFYPYVDWDGNQSGWDVTSKVNLLMRESNQPDAAEIAVPAGTRMTMTGLQKGVLNNVYWVTFEVKPMGKTLVIKVDCVDWYTRVYSGYGYVTSEEAFDGFYYAG